MVDIVIKTATQYDQKWKLHAIFGQNINKFREQIRANSACVVWFFNKFCNREITEFQ